MAIYSPLDWSEQTYPGFYIDQQEPESVFVRSNLTCEKQTEVVFPTLLPRSDGIYLFILKHFL